MGIHSQLAGSALQYVEENKMKITKQRLKEIIREELSLGDLQSDEKFTGGSPEERLLTLMKAREVLAKMSREELEELSLSLDGETTRALQHLLANPIYRD